MQGHLVMAAVGLDSEAAFKHRAIEVGMQEAYYQTLKGAGISTYGKLAFVCGYTPGQGDENVLFDAIAALVGTAPSPTEKIVIRRLFFEANAMALADLRTRFEKDDSSEPKETPLAERMARLQQQKDRLTGVHFSPETEPGHKLVDTVFQMCQDQQINWIPWEKLLSRASEVLAVKKDLQINFDAHGVLKLSNRTDFSPGELSGEIKVRQALSRRSRAFDLASLCDYQIMESWHEKMFEIMQRVPPNNCSPVTMMQAKEADKMLWKKMAESIRGSILIRPDGRKPMEVEFALLVNDPEVQFLMMPMPRAQPRAGPYDDPRDGKGKGKDEKGKGKKGKGKGFELPQGCSQTTKEGKPICNAYNRQQCSYAKDGKRCKRGFHVCWKCFRPKPYATCTHE